MKDRRICIIGLGYVGLPLAVEFGKHYSTVGYDLNPARIAALSQGIDSTLEVEKQDLDAAEKLGYTDDTDAITDIDIYIITVPTPVDESNNPDLRALESASKTVGGVLQKGNIVIYESTVYPGATEEICVPILERESGLKLNDDFSVGYSPERINPGDKKHRLTHIKKVTSASNKAAAETVDALYRSIITAGTHLASSIKVAEAAKVIENTQRDVNIGLINELSMIFNQLGVDTQEVLEAAGTKWNFLPFRPGLVGGHCIGVDPYYLTHKATKVGMHPEMILAGRKINDGMGEYVVDRVVRLMTEKRINVVDANVLVMGLTFKENCPDIRNTRVIDIVEQFRELHAHVDVYDPWVDEAEAKSEYGIDLCEEPTASFYDAIVIAVAHDLFRGAGIDKIRSYGKSSHIMFDVKYLFSSEEVDGRL